jgi:hypothetical protein
MARVGEADRAIEVAVGVDLDDAEARVLLVLRAQAAVERAPVLHLGLGLERDGAGLVEPQRVEVHLGVGVEERVELAVLRAPLAEEHLVVLGVDLAVDHGLADRADALRVLEEDLVAIDLLPVPGHRHGKTFLINAERKIRANVLRTYVAGKVSG